MFNFVSIYFYYLINKKNVKHVIKLNTIHDPGREGTGVDPMCCCLDIFLKSYYLKVF